MYDKNDNFDLNSQGKIENSNGLTFIGVEWFNSVGIVLIQDNFLLEYKCYIKEIQGDNKFNDIQSIMGFGTPFPMKVARTLFYGLELNDGVKFLEDNPEYHL